MTHLHKIGIILNGVTGRMGANQHLLRSIVAIRQQGGVPLNDQETILPEPILVGRNPARLEALAKQAGGARWMTELDSALDDSASTIYFDALVTSLRGPAVQKALAAGKHVYCEKPTATLTADAYDLYRRAQQAGVRHGVVQDKLWLPGLRRLKRLIDSGYFGEILSIRGEFGYWVFAGGDPKEGGEGVAPQRPSWNYRKEDGGGIILDMLCHWRYVLDNLFTPVRSVSCLGATHIPRRWDEQGRPYACTADDSCYATFMLEGGTVAQFNSSWCVRVRRDDLLTLQVDGTKGSAVAGLRECLLQPAAATPRPVWNPDIPAQIDYRDGWTPVPANEVFENAFKAQWERFLRHVVAGDPFPWNLLEGAKGVQLAECALQSWRERAWVDLPELGPIPAAEAR